MTSEPAPLPPFDASDLASRIERLSNEDLDRLPYGVIRVDEEGVVVVYNATERRLSGSGTRPRLGRQFFLQIAPCMNSPAFRGRFEAAQRAGRVDISFDHIGDFDDRLREIRIRMMSASTGGCWIFLQREDET